LYNELLEFPPEGYEFVLNDCEYSNSQSLIHLINKKVVKTEITKLLYDYVRPWAYYFYNKFDVGNIPDVDLTYSSQHVIFRDSPWIVDVEHAGAFAAYGKVLIARNLIEKSLSSDSCKRIIPWTEMGKKTLLSNFNCKGFENKIEVVNLAVRSKLFHKQYDADKIKLLFVGTANQVNIGDCFSIKGGYEVLKAFEILSTEYNNLELVIRSHVPVEIKNKYKECRNLRIIDSILSWDALEHEFKTADIFLFPGHSTPGMSIIDAMSYELPVIATDVWANKELVENGRTGYLIKGSQNVRYCDNTLVPLWGEPTFMKSIRQVDNEMVMELVEKTSELIENEKLRRSMGMNGRKEIDHGKFSINLRNRKLRRIFDEALG